MSHRLFFCFVALFALSGISNSASGAVVLSYVTASDLTLNDTASQAGLTADDLTPAIGLNVVTSGAVFASQAWDGIDFASSVAANDFWSWGFEVNPDSLAMLDDFTIFLTRDNLGPTDFEVQVMVNAAAPLSVLTGTVTPAGGEFTGSLATVPMLNPGDSVDFRLAAWGATGTTGNLQLDFPTTFDQPSLIVNGTVTAVPEPSSLIALTAIGGFLANRRRRTTTTSVY